jgi:hypothetical protein
MDLTINSDYFPKQNEPVGLCSGDVMCFLWGTDWFSNYHIVVYGINDVEFSSYITKNLNWLTN